MRLNGGGLPAALKHWLSCESRATLYSTGAIDRVLTRQQVLRDCAKELGSIQEHSSKSAGNVEGILRCIRLLGGPSVIEPPEVRVQLAQDVCKQMQMRGLNLDLSIYNTLLRVYICNDHFFLPSESLERMKEQNISPNMGTLTLFLEEYCNHGNMAAAVRVLEQMKALGRFKSEPVFAAMVTGHARSGDLGEAEGVISMLRSKNHTPHNIVYSSLLCAFAERGRIKDIEETFHKMCGDRVFPVMKTYNSVMNTLSKYGHGDLVAHVLTCIRNKEWVSSDLRFLAYHCLVRGEVEAPRLLIKELAQGNGLHLLVLIMYVTACIAQRQSLTEVKEHLETDVDIKLFPQLWETVAMNMNPPFTKEIDQQKSHLR